MTMPNSKPFGFGSDARRLATASLTQPTESGATPVLGSPQVEDVASRTTTASPLRTYPQQNTASLSVSIEDFEKINQGLLWMPVQMVTAVVKRIWWHTKGYSTIVGIMLLTLVSMIFLVIHWSGRNLLPGLKDQIVSGNQWNMRSSK
ncbi:hypothetical protein JYQ62_29290 [Nostoc sp. UHCC 0702]|nr:hypothetical protein JYQ62_29290 [Nostoc sp. UHCC 0702]